jgi:hypothetical protein
MCAPRGVERPRRVVRFARLMHGRSRRTRRRPVAVEGWPRRCWSLPCSAGPVHFGPNCGRRWCEQRGRPTPHRRGDQRGITSRPEVPMDPTTTGRIRGRVTAAVTSTLAAVVLAALVVAPPPRRQGRVPLLCQGPARAGDHLRGPRRGRHRCRGHQRPRPGRHPRPGHRPDPGDQMTATDVRTRGDQRGIHRTH